MEPSNGEFLRASKKQKRERSDMAKKKKRKDKTCNSTPKEFYADYIEPTSKEINRNLNHGSSDDLHSDSFKIDNLNHWNHVYMDNPDPDKLPELVSQDMIERVRIDSEKELKSRTSTHKISSRHSIKKGDNLNTQRDETLKRIANPKTHKKKSLETPKESNLTEIEAFYRSDKDPFDQPFELSHDRYEMLVSLSIKDEMERVEKFMNNGRMYVDEPQLNFGHMAHEIEGCDRDYVRDFLREVDPDNPLERMCYNGEKCICMKMAIDFPDKCNPNGQSSKPDEAFICREFLNPGQLRTVMQTKKYINHLPLPCRLCKQAAISFMMLYYEKHNIPLKEVLHDYYDLVTDQSVNPDPSKYSINDCMYPSPEGIQFNGIIRPVKYFSSTNYTYCKLEYVTINGREIHIKGLLETDQGF